jgi:hypothetical protein
VCNQVYWFSFQVFYWSIRTGNQSKPINRTGIISVLYYTEFKPFLGKRNYRTRKDRHRHRHATDLIGTLQHPQTRLTVLLRKTGLRFDPRNSAKQTADVRFRTTILPPYRRHILDARMTPTQNRGMGRASTVVTSQSGCGKKLRILKRSAVLLEQYVKAVQMEVKHAWSISLAKWGWNKYKFIRLCLFSSHTFLTSSNRI